MKSPVSLVLLYFISVSFCQDETVLHCAAKPGCQINVQCDSVPVGWSRPGFNINQHLQAKEFPITCKSDSKGKDSFNWLPLITGNVVDIKKIESELEEFQNEMNERLEELKNFTTQIKGYKKIEEGLAEHKKELAEQKKELAEQKKTNNRMLTVLEKMVKKIAAMERSSPQPGKEIKPTAKAQVTSIYNPESRNCQLKVGKVCYFTSKLEHDFGFSYSDGVTFCRKYGGYVVLIRDEFSYEKIMLLVREGLIAANIYYRRFWTRNRIDPTTADTTPVDAYFSWNTKSPLVGNTYSGRTFIYIYVMKTKNPSEGMSNDLVGRVSATVCEILDES